MEGYRFGILEDKGAITNAVTVAGSTKVFDFAATMPNGKHTIEDAVAMASFAANRLNGNKAIKGNLGIGLAHDYSTNSIYYAYATAEKQTKAYSLPDAGNEDRELMFILKGAQAYIHNSVFVPHVFTFPEKLPTQEGDVQILIGQIVELAHAQNWSITTSESCTGGYLAKQFAANQANFFLGGVTLYNEQQKIKEGVSAEQLLYGNVYSPEVALAMARAACLNSGASISIATTGVMENPDTRFYHEHVAPGTVYYAFVICGKPFSREIHLSLANASGFTKTREELKRETSMIILSHLLECMKDSIALFTMYSKQE